MSNCILIQIFHLEKKRRKKNPFDDQTRQELYDKYYICTYKVHFYTEASLLSFEASNRELHVEHINVYATSKKRVHTFFMYFRKYINNIKNAYQIFLGSPCFRN